MNVAINKKIDSMGSITGGRGLLFAILSSVLMLAACSTSPERPTEVFEVESATIPISADSAVISGSNANVVTPKSNNSRSIAKTTTKNRIPKPYTGNDVEKKIYKKPIKKKKIVLKKTSVKKINTEKTAIAKASVEKKIIVDKTESIKKLAEVSNVDVPIYSVDLSKLPLLIGNNWTLRLDADISGQCVLSYRNLVMGDGQGETPVIFIVTQDEVLFKTKSNIDIAYQQTGVTIDDQPQLPIETLYNDYSISYKTQYQTLVGRMKAGEQAVLTLGFWPSWPITDTRSINIELGQFSAAQQALNMCLELEKELK
jgi:hypothetical protein